MERTTAGFAVERHFVGKDAIVRRIYDRLTEALGALGPITEEPKKTSIHLVNATALAGVATRRDYLILTVKGDRELMSPRIRKTERVSARRFHHELKLTSPADVDEELIGWLREAYSLSA